MGGEEKKYRRTKKIVEHANPLFDDWLLEWQREAEKRGSNMKYNFQRARKSLSLYPLPLYSGQDCKLLANFGTKICQMLVKRLAQHEEEFGATDWTEVHKMKETSKKRKKKQATSKQPTTITHDAIPSALPRTTARSRKPLTPQSSKEPSSEENHRTKRTKTTRHYIPVVRSGAYALLMTLHRASFLPHHQGFMKKEELVAAAQPLCDASLLKSDKVGSYYTAWSSMQTLIKKGLVLRQSHPPRFSITEEGKSLALKLENAEQNIDSVECVDPSAAASSNSGTEDEQSTSHPIPTHALSSSDNEDDDDDDGVEEVNCSPSHSTTNLTQSYQIDIKEVDEEDEEESGQRGGKAISSWPVSHNKNHMGSGSCSTPKLSANPIDGLRFSYVTAMDMETPLKDHAGVTVEEDGFLGFLIKCGASDLQESGFHYRLDHTRTAPSGLTYAYLSNESAPDQCTGLHKAAGQSLVPPPTTTIASSKQPTTNCRKSGVSQLTSGLEATGIPPPCRTRTSKPHTEVNIETLAVTPASSCVSFTLMPENYEIILCIDIAETNGKSSGVQPSNKDIILSELTRNGVKYSIRKLHVGDYLWVCRETSSSATSQGNFAKETRELVLPVVVERKRMDDLACSIKDGRFKEQKFRLMQCGLSHPVYLVEEHCGSVAAGLSLPEMSCLQAVVNTQVINGFTVKVVKGQRESAAYLTIMTRYLQTSYQNKTVKSAQLQDLNGNPTSLSFEIETSMLPFSEFNTASMKNQQLTVREMFAKHLLQLHGISADKARAVVDKYGTPSLLMAAYEEEGSTDEAKKLLAGLKWGKAGRSIGPVLSANIASLYTRAVLQ